MRLLLAASTLALCLAGPTLAAPVTVTQSVAMPTVAPFGTFSSADTLLAGWSFAWPFTMAAQITSVTLTFTSVDRRYNDPTLFPTKDGGGIPGVELGFLDEATSSRRAIASVNAAAPTIMLGSPGYNDFDSLVATLLDGNATFSLGGFYNFPNGGPAFSEGMTFNNGLLTVQIDGVIDGPNSVPEPGSLALAALALLATRVRRGAPKAAEPVHG